MASILKAGSFADFSDSMAEHIDTAMQSEWQAAKGEPLPAGDGADDRKILFAAIAQGVLRYLYEHRHDLLTTVEHDSVDGHSHRLEFDLQEKSS